MLIMFLFLFINDSCVSLHVQVVQLLLSSNMCAAMLEPKPSDPNGVSPLHLAAKNGHIEVIRSEQALFDMMPFSACFLICFLLTCLSTCLVGPQKNLKEQFYCRNL